MGLDRGTRAADIGLKITGKTQGEFKGGTLKKDRKNEFDIWSVYHTVESPRDAQSGMATGRRVHNAIVLVGETTGGVAQMYTALFKNETLSKVVIEYWRSSKEGKQEVYFSITLENGFLLELENIQDETGRPCFRAHITYQSIELTWKEGNLTANDTWRGTQ
jgi:type VI secretion system secreted protein Hcp